MSIRRTNMIFKIVAGLVLTIGALIILFPLFLTVITAFKTPQQSAENFFSLPNAFYIDNFITVFQRAGYLNYFTNSTVITVSSVVAIFVITPMCGYAIARNMKHKKYYKFIYYLIICGIFVPFQVIMLPISKYMGSMGMSNQFGLIILHVTLASAQAIFLLVNYIGSVPPDLEEAASIDGCSTFGAYWRVVLPLIKPMTVTVLILNGLWVWNDFQLPLIILNKTPDTWTLPLFQYNFKSQYTFDYNLAFASYLIAIVPILVFYIFGQKYIVSGLTQGAVKS